MIRAADDDPGGPPAAGEPPRPLKGFQKITLKSGHSAMVQFALGGQDRSYWNDSANGWVIPAGAFRVYVGDSSALADLPPQGSFTVAAANGSRPRSGALDRS